MKVGSELEELKVRNSPKSHQLQTTVLYSLLLQYDTLVLLLTCCCVHDWDSFFGTAGVALLVVDVMALKSKEDSER